MRAILHRAVVIVSGQGDELATPFAGCAGNCHQGRGVCDCDTELALDVHPDAERVIRAPILNRTDRERFEFWRRWSKLIAMASIAALVALLKLAGARSMQ